MIIKSKTYWILLIIALFGALSFYSFDQKGDDVPEILEGEIPLLVQKELDKRLKKYQQTILDKCREKALKAAEAYIDSLVAEEIKLQASDTLKFPSRPIRPELKEPIKLDDSTKIEPIIK
jgi:hypothetical protein